MSKNFTNVIRGLINQEVNAIHTALPAKIIRTDGMNVDVQPLVNIFANGTHRQLPVIYSVPFMPPRTAKAGIQWNPEIGDKVLLMVMEMSIDNLMVGKGSNIVNSEDGRKFDLSDAVAISGFLNDVENKPLPKTDGIQIKYDKQTITIKKNGDIELGGGKVLSNLLTEHFKLALDTHTHNFPAINGASTTPPLYTVVETPLNPFTTSKTKAE